MKKIIIPMLLTSFIGTSVCLADAQNDAAPKHDSRFEPQVEDPAFLDIKEILPNAVSFSIKTNNQDATTMTIETGHHETMNRHTSDAFVFAPMTIEITNNHGGIDDVTVDKVRLAIIRLMGSDGPVAGGYDFIEYESSKKELDHSSYETKKVNFMRLFAKFSFALDSGENVVVNLKAEAAAGVAKEKATVNGVEQEYDFKGSFDYAGSAGVTVMKKYSLDSYYKNTSHHDVALITRGARFVYDAGDFGFIKQGSVFAYTERNDISISSDSEERLEGGVGIKFGF